MLKDTWGHYLEDKFEENLDRIAMIDIGKMQDIPIEI